VTPEIHRTVSRFAAITAFCTAMPVAAQRPDLDPDAGLWWEVSAAAGGARLSCAICDPSRELGPAIGFALGAYASPTVRVGLDGGAWSTTDGDERESVYRAGVVAQLHPRPGRGLHVLAGMGWSGYRGEGFTYDGVRLTMGAGWDLPLTGSWVVGNRITLDGSSFSSLKNDGTVVEPAIGLSELRFGVYLRKR